jgi:hypothetical protein
MSTNYAKSGPNVPGSAPPRKATADKEVMIDSPIVAHLKSFVTARARKNGVPITADR